jgi:dUTP pyrophosphatase
MTALLSDAEIRELVLHASPPLLSGYLDFEAQLQAAGFDVTVQRIVRLEGEAQIGGPYESRPASEVEVAARDGLYSLSPGSYVAYLNEVTAFPLDVAGIALPRSTLFRCGGTLSSGLWDPGFHGRGRLGLSVAGVSSLAITTNCPIAQIAFFRLSPAERGFQFNQFYVKLDRLVLTGESAEDVGLDDLAAALAREGVEADVESTSGTKGELATALIITAGALASAKNVRVIADLLVEWLHRPGERSLTITRETPDGGRSSETIEAHGVSPAQLERIAAQLRRELDVDQ